MAVQTTIRHGVAIFVGFIFAMIIEEATADQFSGVMATVADNITVLYIVLVLALFATRMGGAADRGL